MQFPVTTALEEDTTRGPAPKPAQNHLDEDCDDDVGEAAQVLLDKIVKVLRTTNMHAFFMQINKKGKKKGEVAVDWDEFREGMRTVVYSR